MMGQSNDQAKFWTSKRVATLKRLHAENMTMTEIAAHMCVSKNVICGKVDSFKLLNARSQGAVHLRDISSKKPHINTKKVFQVPSLAKMPPSRVFPKLWGDV